MALNRNFYIPTYELKCGDQVVGTLRGITPNDIARIMSENASDVEALMESWEKDKVLAKVDVSKDAELTAALRDNTAKIFSTVLSLVPELVAKVIAAAMDETDKDAIELIGKLNVALQLEAVVQVAKLTFVDQNGFKAFMGNVMGLVGNVGAGKANQPRSPEASQALTTDTAG